MSENILNDKYLTKAKIGNADYKFKIDNKTNQRILYFFIIF